MTTETTSQFEDWVNLYSNIDQNSIVEYYLPMIVNILNQAAKSKNVENKTILSEHCNIIIKEIARSNDLQTTKSNIKSKFSNLTEKLFKEDYENLPEMYRSFI